MKAQELIELGFKKKTFDGEYWYEKRINKNVKMITNDTFFNKGKDVWQVALQDDKNNVDYWFDNKLKSIEGVLHLQAIYQTFRKP